MNKPIIQVIRACHGYVLETAGMLSAFFTDSRQAQECAERLDELARKPNVEVYGSHLMITLS